jgi:hypothetical protein
MHRHTRMCLLQQAASNAAMLSHVHRADTMHNAHAQRTHSMPAASDSKQQCTSDEGAIMTPNGSAASYTNTTQVNTNTMAVTRNTAAYIHMHAHATISRPLCNLSPMPSLTQHSQHCSLSLNPAAAAAPAAALHCTTLQHATHRALWC